MLQIGFLPASTSAKLCGICLNVRYRNGHWSKKDWQASSYCHSCSARATGRRRQVHQDRSNLTKAYNLARMGIGIDAYNEMWEAQGGKCAACDRPEAECGKYRLAVDHDHSCCSGKRSCGKCIRGLLCSACNMALGLLGDDPRRIANLQAYATERSEVAA
jgi:hypothetical protein